MSCSAQVSYLLGVPITGYALEIGKEHVSFAEVRPAQFRINFLLTRNVIVHLTTQATTQAIEQHPSFVLFLVLRASLQRRLVKRKLTDEEINFNKITHHEACTCCRRPVCSSGLLSASSQTRRSTSCR